MSYALQLRHSQQSWITFFQKWEMPAFLSSVGMRVGMVVIMAILVVGYIMQVGTLTTSGYQIATLEKKVDSLSDDTQKLTSELARFQSISYVEKRLAPGSMVPAANIRHIRVNTETALVQP